MGKRHPVGYYHDDWIVANHRAFEYWADFLDAYCSRFPGQRSAVKMHCKRNLGVDYRNPREDYNEDWILEHWDTERNWNRLANRYNETFGTSISYVAFKSYCNRRLGLNFAYSKQEDEWLTEHFPEIGKNDIGARFNLEFGTKRSNNAVYARCKKLGLKVNEDRRAKWKNRISEVRKRPLGHVAEREHGTLYIKTEDGWKRQKELIIGKQEGKLIIHLDGNKWNLEESNLAVIDRQISAILTAENFWSQDGEITKAGIEWAKLKLLLNERGVNVEGVYFAD